eukprot:CAMPEP_0174843156 /NCGR_PEP_ID=MMETSP1114-20130205/10342_1 /TAXON_ID=312471 /ORGANISM="Neobodo designis, Strain CCAP 1951/1" /LENGTH=84 /DNA_ID=CAMNT_0016077369 /DNA_START=225 /DNA_END=479 /DNA_ORIENTATION=-
MLWHAARWAAALPEPRSKHCKARTSFALYGEAWGSQRNVSSMAFADGARTMSDAVGESAQSRRQRAHRDVTFFAVTPLAMVIEW